MFDLIKCDILPWQDVWEWAPEMRRIFRMGFGCRVEFVLLTRDWCSHCVFSIRNQKVMRRNRWCFHGDWRRWWSHFETIRRCWIVDERNDTLLPDVKEHRESDQGQKNRTEEKKEEGTTTIQELKHISRRKKEEMTILLRRFIVREQRFHFSHGIWMDSVASVMFAFRWRDKKKKAAREKKKKRIRYFSIGAGRFEYKVQRVYSSTSQRAKHYSRK